MGKSTGYIPRQKIERLADELLEKFGIAEPPVHVEDIAAGLNLSVEYAELGDGVSGLLVVTDEAGTIGVNVKDPRVRQRFTIAHEIGHYKLHNQSPDAVFIDKGFTHFRNDRSSRGEAAEEIQANMFAAALLMPASLLTRKIEKDSVDIGDDDDINALADSFQVSGAAMSYRILALFD